MGSIHYYRNATGFTFFDKVLIIGRITIVSTDKENTDLRDHLFLKHRGKIFVKNHNNEFSYPAFTKQPRTVSQS